MTNALPNQIILRKTGAVGEVALVTFAAVPYLTLGIYRLFPRFESWQTETLGFPIPVFVYAVMIGLSLLVIFLRGKKLADYGIHFQEIRYHLDIAAACFIPVVLSNLPHGMGVDYRSWRGALLLAVVNIALLLTLAWLLRSKPTTRPAAVLSACFIWLPGINLTLGSTMGQAFVLFLTYAVFVGFGEEILYRGYMQSRLNEVFGRPYRFFDVPFGWGALITPASCLG